MKRRGFDHYEPGNEGHIKEQLESYKSHSSSEDVEGKYTLTVATYIVLLDLNLLISPPMYNLNYCNSCF